MHIKEEDCVTTHMHPLSEKRTSATVQDDAAFVRLAIAQNFCRHEGEEALFDLLEVGRGIATHRDNINCGLLIHVARTIE